MAANFIHYFCFHLSYKKRATPAIILSYTYPVSAKRILIKRFSLVVVVNNGNSYKEIKLFMEPGRFIVGESGIIIGRVTQIKDRMSTRFIGTNIGMNDLIRPALYDAVHPIYFYSPYRKQDERTVTVVGPICESGDVLVKNLKVKHTITENDIVIVTNTGAYGYSMRSNYNLKEIPVEGFI